VIFIQHGRIILSTTVEDLATRFVQLTATSEQAIRARQLQPFYEREVFGRVVLFFEGRPAEELDDYGETRTPTIADLFVAKMQGAPA
jgi:ABC-2 type transport system ATP-binding protein